MAALDFHPREQFTEEGGNDLFDRDESLTIGQARNPGSKGGILTRAKRLSPRWGSRTMTARLSERLEI